MSPSKLRFGTFDFDLETGELFRAGMPVRLQPQPAQVLRTLIAARGQLVSRESIRQSVWGSEIHVDFDKALNYAISQVRSALRDSADSPRYIETLPKNGYRFIAQLEPSSAETPSPTTFEPAVVALALARARIMGARYPYYLLADSKDGLQREAEITHSIPSEAPTHGNIRQGFVYERVPHVTLKSIANNAEIDVIWEKFQSTLEPLREQLNAALKQKWEEWEIPREADDKWISQAKKLHSEWWQQRIARQKEIDASIAAKADFEYLCDKPYDDKKKVRVAGPFTVESLSPHRVLAFDENDELIDGHRTIRPAECGGEDICAGVEPEPNFGEM